MSIELPSVKVADDEIRPLILDRPESGLVISCMRDHVSATEKRLGNIRDAQRIFVDDEDSLLSSRFHLPAFFREIEQPCSASSLMEFRCCREFPRRILLAIRY